MNLNDEIRSYRGHGRIAERYEIEAGVSDSERE